ncbi:MAG: molecular chaperone HtpG [Lentisphaerae bacterium GWF2_45_14]|nr:MAG: molecular chaperone HtpG [Lentisphaerae bacterium GWF2_45_14]
MSEKTMKFKTEVQQLLDLMIHSLYSNKDIFLRELISNASDALDKARFESLKSPEIAAEWAIRIECDKTHNTVKISDNGIGMTEGEVVENIGTIAKSGTKAFLAAMEKEKTPDSPELIGQFGVGFYSAFMVADKVTLETKRAGSSAPGIRWESTGKEDFVIEECARSSQGTEITMHLKPDMKSYLEEWKIREIVKKYSDFIEYPVKMSVTTKKDGTDVTEDETLNSQKAIWIRNPSEVTEDEYKQFYNYLSHQSANPLCKIHYSAEGTSEFKALLFIPGEAPFDIFFQEQQKKGLHLYIKRVFISDCCEGLLPDYLRFVKGVVDSNDLPLNISREILQDNPQIKKINKSISLRIINELKKILENEREKYISFYKEFGRVVKEGIHIDFANKEKIQELIMYESLNHKPGELITLKEYLTAMPESQKDIYYITGEDRKTLENSPHLELLKSKGYDVLFMTDPVDEWIMQSMNEFDKKKFKPAGKGDIELDEETKKEAEEKTQKAEAEHKKLLELIKEELGDKVKDVRFSKRLTESACCLVSDEFAPGAHMEKIFKAMKQDMPSYKRTLELNPTHPLIDKMQKLFDKEPKSLKLCGYASLLYNQALLMEGSHIPDPLQFSKQITELMSSGI